jgi:hypothetical protein
MIVNKVKLKDLFVLARIIKKLDITPDKMPDNFNQMESQKLALLSFDLIIDGINNCEDDVYTFIASLTNVTPEEVAEYDLDQIEEFITGFLKVNDFKKVFTSAKGLMEKKK